MIRGTISSRREPVVPVTVLAADGTSESFDAVVDTGFTDFLTLPRRAINRLALAPAGPVRGRLADGSEIEVMLFRARLIWDEAERTILVVQAEGKVLAGMSLLYGCDFRMRTVDGGEVVIARLES